MKNNKKKSLTTCYQIFSAIKTNNNNKMKKITPKTRKF